MALTPISKDMAIIAALPDEPNDVGGMTAAELKDKFDEGGKALKTYINGTLIPEIETELDKYDPDMKTSAMTQSVGRDASGKLWTAPGGGGGRTATWSTLTGKPFSTIGTGLKVVGDALMLDAEQAAGNSF